MAFQFRTLNRAVSGLVIGTTLLSGLQPAFADSSSACDRFGVACSKLILENVLIGGVTMKLTAVAIDKMDLAHEKNVAILHEPLKNAGSQMVFNSSEAVTIDEGVSSKLSTIPKDSYVSMTFEMTANENLVAAQTERTAEIKRVSEFVKYVQNGGSISGMKGDAWEAPVPGEYEKWAASVLRQNENELATLKSSPLDVKNLSMNVEFISGETSRDGVSVSISQILKEQAAAGHKIRTVTFSKYSPYAAYPQATAATKALVRRVTITRLARFGTTAIFVGAYLIPIGIVVDHIAIGLVDAGQVHDEYHR